MSYFLDVFDTETAGLSGGVCDIAIVRLNEKFEAVWACESLINPERPIEPSASGIHHIVDEDVKDAPTLTQFMSEQGHPFDRDRLIVGGHNIAFDIRMVGSVLPPKFLKVCTLKLARSLWPNLADHKLQTLRYHFRLEAGDAHRAMGDVVTTISLLRMIARTKGWTLADIVQASAAPLPLTSLMPFGKHKGTPIKDVPRSWLTWALKEMKDLDPDLRQAFAAALS